MPEDDNFHDALAQEWEEREAEQERYERAIDDHFRDHDA